MKELHDLRTNIDVCLALTKHLPYGREISLAVTKLQTAKMWFGKCLIESGEADPNDTFQETPKALDQTKDTSALAGTLKSTIGLADSFQENYSAQDLTLKFRMFYQTAVLTLIEAGMWINASNQTDSRESLTEQAPNN